MKGDEKEIRFIERPTPGKDWGMLLYSQERPFGFRYKQNRLL
jgi:hypothetical protein